jgi:hypothetical protein
VVSNVYRENEVFLDLSINSHVLAFTAGLAILTGLLLGLVPAWPQAPGGVPRYA